jgi:hypothetical protein
MLRTKYGINLTETEKTYLFYNYNKIKHLYSNKCIFENRTYDENMLIQQEMNNYFTKGTWGSCDKTHTDHSKSLTRNRKYDRNQKWNF